MQGNKNKFNFKKRSFEKLWFKSALNLVVQVVLDMWSL